MTLARYRPVLFPALLALALSLGSTAHAQAFRMFAYVLFENLGAYAVDCGEVGWPVHTYPISACAVIPDNYLSLNRRIIERQVAESSLTVQTPWELSSNPSMHQYAFVGPNDLLYALFYLEMSANSSAVVIVGQELGTTSDAAPATPSTAHRNEPAISSPNRTQVRVNIAVLRVRDAPGMSGTVVGRAERNALGSFVDLEHHDADGYRWWHVRFPDGLQGWVADGDDELDYLVLDGTATRPVPSGSD